VTAAKSAYRYRAVPALYIGNGVLGKCGFDERDQRARSPSESTVNAVAYYAAVFHVLRDRLSGGGSPEPARVRVIAPTSATIRIVNTSASSR